MKNRKSKTAGQAISKDSIFFAPSMNGKDRLEFYSFLSHILRGPLVGATGYIDYVFMGYAGALNKQQLRQLSMSRESILELNRVIDVFLDVVAFDLNLIKPESSRIDIAADIKTAQPLFREISVKSKTPISVSVPPEPVYAAMSREWTKPLFYEVAAGAAFFSGEGMPVRITVRRAGRWAEILINVSQDKDSRQTNNLLRPFAAPAYAISKHGLKRTGLGFNLAKKIAEAHGGKLSAKTVRDALLVKVMLPAAAQPRRRTA